MTSLTLSLSISLPSSLLPALLSSPLFTCAPCDALFPHPLAMQSSAVQIIRRAPRSAAQSQNHKLSFFVFA